MRKPLGIIFYYKKTGKQALSVVAGALQTHSSTRQIPLFFPNNHERLVKAIESSLADYQQVVVCWSFYSPQFLEIQHEIKQIKILFPGVLTLAGGVHATAEPLQTLKAGFDYVAIGEGEQIIIDFCLALLKDTAPEEVKGIAHLHEHFLNKNGKGQHIALDDYPPFAYHHRKYGPIEITRGCIYACSFCQTPFVNKARFRHRSIDNILFHAKKMSEFGLRDFRFITPTAFSYGSTNESVNLEAIEELLAALRAGLKKTNRIFFGTFPSEVRPEHVSDKALLVLKKYVDNDNLIIGGQSGSQKLLDKTHRGHSVEAIIQAVKLAVKHGFKPNVDFLYGMPGESCNDAKLTRQLAQTLVDLGARIHSHTFMPLPGTPLKSAKAGTVDIQTQKYLHHLESNGKAYGPWQNHMQIAQKLEANRIEFYKSDITKKQAK